MYCALSQILNYYLIIGYCFILRLKIEDIILLLTASLNKQCLIKRFCSRRRRHYRHDL